MRGPVGGTQPATETPTQVGLGIGVQADMIEHRTVRAEIRSPPDQPGTFEATVMHYGIVDDYGTVFDPGVFTASLDKRLPRITWGHDWADVIGRVVDFKDGPDS